MEFNTLGGVLKYIRGCLKLGLDEYMGESRLLRKTGRQTNLDEFT